MAQMQCAEAIVDWLSRAGVRQVFLVPGAHIGPLILALSRQNYIQPITCAHEQSAAFMADGCARANQRIGVCLGIGGPGAANFLSAAVTARVQCVPVLYLTGNPPTLFAGRGAFQDGGVHGSRDVALFEVAAGFSTMVTRPQDLEPAFREVVRRLSGRPAQPAHVMLPYDLQLADYHGRIPDWSAAAKPAGASLTALYEGLARTVFGAGRIAILAGPEINTPAASRQLQEFAELYQIPVAVTADAKGIFPPSHRLYLGVFGFGGGDRAAAALLDPELEALLVLGLIWTNAIPCAGTRGYCGATAASCKYAVCPGDLPTLNLTLVMWK
jgi:acetolactate synthase-1/2/3 large subunit